MNEEDRLDDILTKQNVESPKTTEKKAHSWKSKIFVVILILALIGSLIFVSYQSKDKEQIPTLAEANKKYLLNDSTVIVVNTSPETPQTVIPFRSYDPDRVNSVKDDLVKLNNKSINSTIKDYYCSEFFYEGTRVGPQICPACQFTFKYSNGDCKLFITNKTQTAQLVKDITKTFEGNEEYYMNWIDELKNLINKI